jgi:gamma-glutamyltranspeptidase/glutathione hydrolase
MTAPSTLVAAGCVAAGHPVTADAAHEVLRAGGNAFDAALAAVAAACVAEPVLASPGGGGFLLARPADGPRASSTSSCTPRACAGRPPRRAPTRSSPTGAPPSRSFRSASAPPRPRASSAACSRCTRPRPHADAEILAPAVPPPATGVVRHALPGLPHDPRRADLPRRARRARAVRRPRGRLAQLRRPHANPDLGALFEQLGRDGERLFYEGEVAAAIVAQCREHGGHITQGDLRRYRVAVREPLTLRYRDATIITNPPPSAGGTLIAFGLGLLARVLAGSALPSAPRAPRPARPRARPHRRRPAAHGNGETCSPTPCSTARRRYAAELAAARAAHRGTTHISVIDREATPPPSPCPTARAAAR